MPGKNDLRYVNIPFYLADVSTAGQVYVPVTANMEGEIKEIRTVLNGTIATANAVLTPKIGGTAVTNGAITITASGSAAGDLDSSAPTAANAVVEGDAIEIETNGASTNAVEVFGMILIAR